MKPKKQDKRRLKRGPYPHEQWIAELLAAGWEPYRMNTLWKAPNGALFIEPYGAWKRMRVAMASKVLEDNR